MTLSLLLSLDVANDVIASNVAIARAHPFAAPMPADVWAQVDVRALDRMRAQGDGDDSPTVATPEQLAALREVLARSEFGAAAGRGMLDGLLDPVRAVLRRVVGEILLFILRLLGGGAGEPIAWGVVAVGAVVMAGAALVVWRFLRGTVAADDELAATALVRTLRADEELARARELAQAGDLRAAVHHRYLAVLRRLDERGVLRFERSLTNRELLPKVPSDAAVGAPLAPLVAQFDRLWYGQSTCSREEYEQFAQLANRVWEAAA